MRQPRFRYRRSFFHDNFTTGVKWLLFANVGTFLLWDLGGRAVQNNLLILFGLNPEVTVRGFFVWQVATYLFLHGGVWHLIFNMLTLWMFGTPLERDWGTRRFIKYYFICGVGAGLCDLALNILLGQWNSTTIGASGAIYGLLVAFGVLYPNQTVLMSFLFPIKAKYMVMIYAGVELLMSVGVNSGVSNIAHLGGMAVGYLYLKSKMPGLKVKLPDWRGAYRQWRLQRAKKKFQVYMRKHGGPGPRVN
jgi:membrane associated rhomboid family serine protease